MGSALDDVADAGSARSALAAGTPSIDGERGNGAYSALALPPSADVAAFLKGSGDEDFFCQGFGVLFLSQGLGTACLSETPFDGKVPLPVLPVPAPPVGDAEAAWRSLKATAQAATRLASHLGTVAISFSLTVTAAPTFVQRVVCSALPRMEHTSSSDRRECSTATPGGGQSHVAPLKRNNSRSVPSLGAGLTQQSTTVRWRGFVNESFR